MKDYMYKKDKNQLGISLTQQRFAKSHQRVTPSPFSSAI